MRMTQPMAGAPLSRRVFIALASLAGMSLAGCSFGHDVAELASDADAPGATSASAGDPLLKWLTLEQKAAQIFVVRPEQILGVYHADAGAEDAAVQARSADYLTAADDVVGAAIGNVPVGGFAFFGGNLRNPAQATALLADLRDLMTDACGIPPLLCVDEEGGTVARIAGNRAFGIQNVGDMAAIGATGDPASAQRVADAMAAYLAPLGFNVDFAPVCDIVTDPKNVMMKRSFGADADLVAQMVAAQVRGFAEGGIACCLKHFPGIGAAMGDSHASAIATDADLAQLEACELVPFQAGIDAGAPLVMVGHLSLPQVTGSDVPASLSHAIVDGILRDQLGFGGIVITDSLAMGAITDRYPAGEAAVMALEAGCDIVLMPPSLQEAYEAVLAAVDSGRLTEERLDESVTRILALKRRVAGSLWPIEAWQRYRSSTTT